MGFRGLGFRGAGFRALGVQGLGFGLDGTCMAVRSGRSSLLDLAAVEGSVST